MEGNKVRYLFLIPDNSMVTKITDTLIIKNHKLGPTQNHHLRNNYSVNIRTKKNQGVQGQRQCTSSLNETMQSYVKEIEFNG